MRGLWITSVIFLFTGMVLLVVGLARPGTLFPWFDTHGIAMLVGGILVAIEALHYLTLERFFPGRLPKDRNIVLTTLYAVGAMMVTIGTFLAPLSPLIMLVTEFGWAVLVSASIVSLSTILDMLPGRKESVVDEDKDPLTKGDDASLKHIRFAHFLLPIGLVAVAFKFFPFLSELSWAQGVYVGGLHLVGIGYGLLSMYGIGHLWVPRFSGVPAIAAGAIKGELHSTLPAMILLPVGFAIDNVGLIIAGGAFAFLGFFTYMGVLGANIMRNKSPTHRVTPEFVYIPWTFTGIFWLVSGVLMGIFLNAVPELLSGIAGGLKSIHVHVALFGGILQLVVGWLTRIVPEDGVSPPRFTGTMSGSFYMFNTAVVATLFGLVGSNNIGLLTGVGLFALAWLWYIMAMKDYLSNNPDLGL